MTSSPAAWAEEADQRDACAAITVGQMTAEYPGDNQSYCQSGAVRNASDTR
jgi:hypothetical protein